MKNKIILADLQKWKEETTVSYAFSLPEAKSLECTLNGTFIVKHKGEVVWQGIQVYSAMEQYNKIGSSDEYKEREFTIGEELTFDVYGNIIVGTFESIKGKIINVKVISDTTPLTKKGDITRINKGFLTK